MEKLTCIIVDDIEIDRLMVASYINRFSSFEIFGVFSNSKDAFEAIEKNKIEILFLDIDMPNLNGIDLRKKALEIPVCVFDSIYFKLRIFFTITYKPDRFFKLLTGG